MGRLRRSHREALRDYRRSLATKSPRTQELWVRDVQGFLEELGKPLKTTTRRDVEAHLARLQALGIAASSRARTLSALRGFARFLCREQWVEGLAVSVPASAPIQLSQEGVQRVLAATLRVGPDSGWWPLSLRDRVLIELLYGCALRRSEVLAVRVVDLDLGAGTLLVRRVKNTEPGLVPVPAAAVEWVRRYLEQRPRLIRGQGSGHLLVTRRGEPLVPNDVNRIVQRTGRRAGVKVHPHALRRACATHLVEAGATVRAVQVLLGHASLEHTAAYVRVGREALKASVGKLPLAQSC